MMHYEDGHLMAYLDGELSAQETAATGSHLQQCEACSGIVAKLESDRAVTANAMGKLSAAAEKPVESAMAFADATKQQRLPTERPKRDRTAPAQPWVSRVGLGRIVAAAAALLIAVSLSFAPVRTFASNLLQVFRVQEVQTVTFTQADIQELQAALQGAEGHFDLDDLGEIWVDGEQGMREVTLAEAQAALDFEVILPEDQGEPTLWLAEGATWRFKLDVDSFNTVLESFGSTHLLPDALDGEVFTVVIPDALTADYMQSEDAEEYGPYLVVGQTRSPELIVPEDVDAAELRDIVLNLPLLPPHLVEQLAAIDDWQNTLVIPNIDGTATDIEIAGNSAVLVSEGAADDAQGAPLSNAGVIWNHDGVVRAVGGNITGDEAIAIAESMMR